mmetsp:Transcript_107027/g.284782  ORF Transcript_107027/g.284782 Transcript_107027/m.284782 type:complete len:293 (-) Transcript_107027:174-1052(-)
MAQADPNRGDWQCPNEQCYNHTNYPMAYVYGSSVNCKKCGTGRAAVRPGDWCCPNPQCMNHTNCVYASKAACPKCGCPKPTGSNGGAGGAMGQKGGMAMGMAMGGMGMNNYCVPGMPPTGVSPPRIGDWHCPVQACKNYRDNVIFSSKLSCPICGTAKPESPVMAAPAPTPVMGMGGGNPMVKGARPGDWHCANPDCKNHTENVVYGSKDICPLCAMPKPVIPVTTAAPPRFAALTYGGAPPRPVPNQRPGDWHCANPNCKNHTDNIVYAGKTVCPLCFTPKDDSRVRAMPY